MNNYRTVAMALGTVLTLGLTNASYANNYNPIPAELKFVGTFNTAPVFQLELNNTDKAEYTVTVRDADKKILLSEKISGEKISRKYKLDAEDISLVAGTTFEVTNKKTNETSVYEINTSSSFVTDVTIAKK
jgi:hypothetical protein